MQGLRGCLLKNALLAAYTSWRVGGPARCLYVPKDREDLTHFLKQLPPEEPLLFLGLGSNVLVRDGGFEGTVVITQPGLRQLQLLDRTSLYQHLHGAATPPQGIMSEHYIYAESGVASPLFARFATRSYLSGAEFLAGIPGTIGGALAMNAGCNGCETWDIVYAAETINRLGKKRIRFPHEYHIAYRSVSTFTDEYYLAAYFHLQQGQKAASLEKIKALLAYRTATQPTHESSCGSVFMNPIGQHAARLIEESGLKGLRIGGASVSTKHANFIINENHASAADIEALIDKVRQTVLETHHVHLVCEVRILGRSAAS